MGKKRRSKRKRGKTPNIKSYSKYRKKAVFFFSEGLNEEQSETTD
jgi:hypothetical protein